MFSQRSRTAAVLLLGIMLQLCTYGCGATVRETLDDATIISRVRAALLNDPQIGATQIDVTASAGVVTMTGAVKSRDQEARAIQVARRINGVKDVRSTLRIE